MIVRFLDRYINLSLVREIVFDGEATTLIFDHDRSDNPAFDGDFREHVRSMTGGSIVVAVNGRPA